MVDLLGVEMSVGTLATWSASVFTFGALVTALVQIAIERNSRKASESRAQAIKVSAWLTELDKDPAPVTLRNASDEPVYSVVVSIVGVQGAVLPPTVKEWWQRNQSADHYTFQTHVFVLPPGIWCVSLDCPQRMMGSVYWVEVGFQDARGQKWIRHGNGNLERLADNVDLFNHYKVLMPGGWQWPKPSL